MAHQPLPEAQAAHAHAAEAKLFEHDRELVAAVLRKDRKATARFVSDHVYNIYAYLRHRLAPRPDLVDDVVQEVFLAALGSLSSFLGTSSLRTWLFGIARHKVESYYRQRLREPEPLAEGEEGTDLPTADPPADERIDRVRMEARTRRVLKQLPEAYSMLLLWRYWENRSVREIAEATGTTEKAIERRLARARARFKEIWSRV